MLDKLRSSYAAAPPGMRAAISPLIALVPVRFRYGKTFFKTQKDILRAQRDIDWLEKQRLKRLRKLVAAASKAPYYQKQFQKSFGGMPDIDHFTFDDLAKLPIVSKEVLRERAEELLSVPQEEADIASTSGSSGRPVKFWLDQDRGAKEFAYITHFWSRIGFKVGHSRRAVFRGVQMASGGSWQWDPALLELRLSAFHMQPTRMQEFCELIEQYKIEYFHGYPSAISVFANYVLHSGWRAPSCLRGILPASEPLLPEQQALIERAFPGAVIQKYYGMSEKVLIAGQLPEDANSYAFEPLYGHAEIVDSTGNPCKLGEQGRIIGTGFISYAMPLLRYDMEDEATLLVPLSRENGYRMQVGGIIGSHRSDYVVGRNGELISFTALNAHGESYTRMHSFQFHQEAPGVVTLRAVPQQGVRVEQLEPFVEELHQRVGDAISFRLQILKDIPFATTNGKRAFIDQKLDVSQYQKKADVG